MIALTIKPRNEHDKEHDENEREIARKHCLEPLLPKVILLGERLTDGIDAERSGGDRKTDDEHVEQHADHALPNAQQNAKTEHHETDYRNY